MTDWLKKLFLHDSLLTRAVVRRIAGPGSVAMLMVVRDESDVIEQNIDFHLHYGVEHFIITDNGSVDGTREILQKFERRLGTSFVVLDDPKPGHYQAERMGRMIGLAKERFKPKWILPSDADEFWYPVSGRYTTEADGRGNLIECHWHNFLPSPQTPWQQFTAIGEMPGYHARMKKSFCLARGLLGLYPGNHEARSIPHIACTSQNIRVYHYPIRSYAQFERKVVNGYRAAKAASADRNVAWHWREYYESWERGDLPQTYEAISTNNRTATDQTMADLFRSQPDLANKT